MANSNAANSIQPEIWEEEQTRFEQQLSDSQVLSLTLKQRGYAGLTLTDPADLRLAHLCLDFSLNLIPNCSPRDAARHLRAFMEERPNEKEPETIIARLQAVFKMNSAQPIIRDGQATIWQLTKNAQENMLFIYKNSGEYYALGHSAQLNTLQKLLRIYHEDTEEKPTAKKIIAALYKMFNGMTTKRKEPCHHRIEILTNQLRFEIFGGKTAETRDIGFDFFKDRVIKRKTGLGPTRQAFYTMAELADRP